ncbi:hypothetical protein HMPREF9952_0940 [Haemophilus pittmaniae HK 85]|uniref:Uncharacterized protein n=2 Tax=Haemophilus pittmaniae TaxID=249188 RepID=A0A377J026_9PAST|nr:hypothetical protein HMPREF9952_0940 [Haemophilus pittmaniae HK 85]SNV83863.1 Uncharacterised protein [Haemophilus pittmaniae]STO93762.1 Uncharacterised protein [Haemophilus pittmaniae]
MNTYRRTKAHLSIAKENILFKNTVKSPQKRAKNKMKIKEKLIA